MTGADWAAYEFLFGREAMLRARAQYAQAVAEAQAKARKEHRRRLAVALTFYAVSAVLTLGALHGFILLLIAGYGSVTGTL